jgi:hypothetical protein
MKPSKAEEEAFYIYDRLVGTEKIPAGQMRTIHFEGSNYTQSQWLKFFCSTIYPDVKRYNELVEKLNKQEI